MKILLFQRKYLEKIHSIARYSPWRAYFYAVYLSARDRLVWTLMSKNKRCEALSKNENKTFFERNVKK